MCHLLACDLDGTLLPLDDTDRSLRAVRAFTAAVSAARPGWRLAYVTGRHLELALEGVEAVGLPAPDYLACDVGTTVYRAENGGWAPDPAFRALMREAMGDADADAVRRHLAGVEGLEPQEPARQGDFKASFVFPWRERARIERAVVLGLRRAEARGRLVVSRDALDGRGLLDVLPQGGSKDRAVRHLADALDIPPERVVFAGDSGNDRDALLAGWGGVLVGNASDELRAEIRREARRLGVEARVHLARAPFAEGVLEGVRALGFDLGAERTP